MIDEKITQLPAVTALPLNALSYLIVSEYISSGVYRSKKILFSDLAASSGSLAWLPAAAFLNPGFSEYIGGGQCTADYVKDTQGFVWLRGFIERNPVPSGITGPQVVYTLPPGYRPTKEVRMPIYFAYYMSGSISGFTDWNLFSCRVMPNGDIELLGTINPGGTVSKILFDLSSLRFATF